MTAPHHTDSNPLLQLNSKLGRVPMEIKVEFGRARMLVSEMLALTPGGIVKLDRRQGDLATLYVEDRAFAEGELVHVQGTDQMGFRVIRILGADNDQARV